MRSRLFVTAWTIVDALLICWHEEIGTFCSRSALKLQDSRVDHALRNSAAFASESMPDSMLRTPARIIHVASKVRGIMVSKT